MNMTNRIAKSRIIPVDNYYIECFLRTEKELRHMYMLTKWYIWLNITGAEVIIAAMKLWK
jgi:hypothetical protein